MITRVIYTQQDLFGQLLKGVVREGSSLTTGVHSEAIELGLQLRGEEGKGTPKREEDWRGGLHV